MIPALLQLDQDIKIFLDNLLEPGTEQDYVTFEYLFKLYHPKENHHIDQITTRPNRLRHHISYFYNFLPPHLNQETP